MEDIYNENGELVDDVDMVPYGASVTNRAGSSSSNSQTVGGSVTSTNSSKESSGTSTTTKRAYDGPVPQIPVTPLYEAKPYDESGRGKMFADMIKRAEEKKPENLGANLSQQDIARRKGRYLAWSDMLNSLGQVSGVGYAPVSRLDNSRTLKAFDKLDELRKDAYKIQSDDNLNWIQKLALEDRIKHDAQETAKIQASQKQQQTDLYHNAQLKSAYERGLAGTDRSYNNQSNTSGQSDSEYWSQTRGSKQSSSTSNTETFRNPEYLWYSNAGGKPVRIGKSNDIPVTGDEANRIYNAVNDLILKYGNNPDSIPADGVEIDLGSGKAKMSKDALVRVSTSLGQIMNVINNDPLSDESIKALPRVVDAMDRLSGYTISDHYGVNGNMAGYAPVKKQEQQNGAQTQTAVPADKKWEANKRK